MTKALKLILCVAALAAATVAPARADYHEGNRVIVSTTLDSTLQVFDSVSLEQRQPPLPVKGTSPVRLWVDEFGGKQMLFSANHGVEGSVGVYDLEGLLVTEYPASPFPARPGAVGIVAGEVGDEATPMVFVTNTWQALGGCGMPTGSVTAYNASLLATAGVMVETGTTETSGPIPYAVALDEQGARVFASTNCTDKIDVYSVATGELGGPQPSGALNTADGPDATLYDQGRGLLYTVNIAGSSLQAHDPADPTAKTTVPMPGARPIDATLATSPAGADWVITSNGGNDTVGIVDRDILDACIAANAPTCPQAYVKAVPTGVPGGAPEGVAYDPDTNRIFSVNKGIMAPSLSVIQLVEQNGSITATNAGTIPLRIAGAGTPVPSVIAFDVVVAPR